jgi:hypothetical protein
MLTPPGSFGTYPRTIRAEMRRFQDASEARPDSFLRYDYPKLIDESREAMAKVLYPSTHPISFPNHYQYIYTHLTH